MPVEDADIRRLSQGMDGRGLAPARVFRDGPVAIVHRQTQITREDRGERQPLAGASGKIIAADSRLNDRAALVRALGLPDEAQNQADSALLLQALEKWGVEAALKRLQGDFGFALWDPEARRLTLAKDFCGSRSLLVHRGPKLIAFATRLRPLLALPGIPRDLDEITMSHFLIMHNGRSARSFYKAIDRVPDAGFLTLTAGASQETIYWIAPVPGSLRPRSDKAVEEQAQAVLDVCVADAMRSDGPVTAFLTSGLDTSNVVASALRLVAPGRLAAITRGVDGPYPPDNSHSIYEEARRAREFAAMHPNLDWREVGEDGTDWGEHDRRRWFLETGFPSRGPSTFSWFYPLYRDMAARGSKVALTGDMGNAFFSYSGENLQTQLFESGRWWALARTMFAMWRGGIAAKQVALKLIVPYLSVEHLMKRNDMTGTPWDHFTALKPEFIRQTRLAEQVDMNAFRIRLGFGSRSSRILRRDLARQFMTGDNNNTLRALSGIDARKPLADRRVIEFFGALPTEQFLKDGVPRSLPRRLLAGHAPPRTVANRQVGTQNGDWHHRLTAQLPQWAADIERLRSSPAASAMVDLDQLERLVKTWPTDVVEAEEKRFQYMIKLQNGVELARFLAWHEGSNF